MSILKEMCTEEIEDPNVRTTYQYVLYLKDILQTVVELAKKKIRISVQEVLRQRG